MKRRFYYFLREFGYDPIKNLGALRGMPKYLKDYVKYRRIVKHSLLIAPALNDFNQKSSDADGHYFWQDLICAQWIFKKRSESHLDVGSRVDGFIAHLLCFMKVTQVDIRPPATSIPGLTTEVFDLQKSQEMALEYDSVSSLHSIEHFGLGRYGDPIDVNGHKKGLLNIAKRCQIGGTLYISFPIGAEKVEFNSQRIIYPTMPQTLLKNFSLEEFVVIPWKGVPIFGTFPEDFDFEMKSCAGLYRFKRVS